MVRLHGFDRGGISFTVVYHMISCGKLESFCFLDQFAPK